MLGGQVGVEQLRRLRLGARHQVPVEVERDRDVAWPMNVESAFAFTPAAIISEANVWRHSCSVIRLSPAASHAASARSLTARVNGVSASRPNTSPASRPGAQPVLDQLVAQPRDDRDPAAAGLRLRLDHALAVVPAALDADDARRRGRRPPSAAPSARRAAGPRRARSPTARGRASGTAAIRAAASIGSAIRSRPARHGRQVEAGGRVDRQLAELPRARL